MFSSICRVKVDGHDVNVKVGLGKDPQKTATYAQALLQSSYGLGYAIARRPGFLEEIEAMGGDPAVDVNCQAELSFNGYPTFRPVAFTTFARAPIEVCGIQYHNPKTDFTLAMEADGRKIGLLEYLSCCSALNRRNDAFENLYAYQLACSLIQTEAFGLKKAGDEIVPYPFIMKDTPFPDLVIGHLEDRLATVAQASKEDIVKSLRQVAVEIAGQDGFAKSDMKRFDAVLADKAGKYLNAPKESGGYAIDSERVLREAGEYLTPFDKACSNLVQAKRLWRVVMQEMSGQEQPKMRYDSLNAPDGVGQRAIYDIMMKDVKATPAYKKALALG